MTFNSVYDEIKFNQLKVERYKKVIKQLVDIRDSEVAYKKVKGEYTSNYDSLIHFIENAKVPITQRRDSTVRDEAQSKAFGIDMFTTVTLVDTLSYYTVKDSVFKGTDRYKTMMNLGVGEVGKKFKLQAGKIEDVAVFEVRVEKKDILSDQESYLIEKEKQVVSVDGVNGDALTVGSMEEVNTNGNWPKNFSKEQ